MKRTAFFSILFLIVNLSLVALLQLSIEWSSVVLINVFLFSLSVLGTQIQRKITGKNKATPTYFLAINFARILLCVLFLIPIIIEYEKTDAVYIYNFFSIYFLYLVLDMTSMNLEKGKV